MTKSQFEDYQQWMSEKKIVPAGEVSPPKKKQKTDLPEKKTVSVAKSKILESVEEKNNQKISQSANLTNSSKKVEAPSSTS